MSVADQPFPELRVAILLVFQALAFQPWGQTIMNDHPGFREYLLDRSTEKKQRREGRKMCDNTNFGRFANCPGRFWRSVLCSVEDILF